MRLITYIFITMFLCLSFVYKVEADTIIFSSDNLNFSQPINVISDPSTTIQLGYNFPIYHNWLYADFRGRTPQQNSSEVITVNTGTSIATEKIAFMPSFDAGVRVRLKKDYPFVPYLFSLLNYTTVNLTTEYGTSSLSKDVSELGLRIGAGSDFQLSHRLPSWLFNIDTGYQYIPANVCSLSMNGIFFSLGFGLSF
ncbi:MAG: hypothetical protein ACP5JP_04315 [bacterium]